MSLEEAAACSHGRKPMVVLKQTLSRETATQNLQIALFVGVEGSGIVARY